ncbi:Nacht domain protein [Lasiodiplodia theobromae]|uniref:Nacht domain protein n=1 Tax=Lasiodiplodia theobromae TaxID=45133 RepID=UPI0015C37209|nr:Nacht domain protein [Lasiodiplodia theobromae]KAF4539116.1 Nacht domain protein [Lasiodiplodia theobromae]
MTEAKKERILQKNARALIERNRRETTWIFDNDNYLRWFAQADSALLGIFGIPGSGKSILASQVIDTLSSSYDGEANLCYYYCDYADCRTLSAYTIIATILRQWLGHPVGQKVGLQEWIIDQFYEQQFRPPIDDLISKVLEVLAESTEVCLVLDGLDELDDDEQVILATTMARLLQVNQCQVKIVASCRGESMKRKVFWYSGFSVTMSPQELGGDMEVFVEHAIDKKIQDGELNLNNVLLKQEVVAKLTDGAQAMFLWVHFQIAELCEARSEDEIRRALTDLPRDLSKTYLRIVTRIFGSKTAFSTERVELIFCWLMCARRLLTIEELSEALAIREDDTCLVRDRIVLDGKQLLQDCGNLVVVDPEDGTVKFAHHTVREFFIRRHWELSIIVNLTDEDDAQNHSILPDANSKIARLCLQYLHFSDFESQITLRSENQTAVPFNEGFIEAIVPQQLSPIARTVADRFFRPTHRTRDITLKFPQKREYNPLEQKYHMLDYVTGG